MRTVLARWLPRLGLALGALALSLALVEIGLRLLGARVLARQDAANRRGLEQASAVVLCLGESTTQGRADTSWPLALQALLDQRLGAGRVKVVNRGVSGTNSRDIVARLPTDLDDWRPDLVISMVGINDHCLSPWEGALDAIPAPDAVVVPDTPWRVVKLAWWTWRALHGTPLDLKAQAATVPWSTTGYQRGGKGAVPHDPPTPALREADALADGPDPGRAEQAYGRVVTDEPLYLDAWLHWAAWRERTDRREEAIRLLQSALPVLPGATWLRRDLALMQARAGRHADAADLLEQAVALDPFDDVLHALLATELRALGRDDEASRRQAQARTLRAERPNPATVRNYRRLAARVLESGAALIAMQYPRRDPDLLRRMLDGWSPPVIVQDQTEGFERALAHQPYDALFTDRFGGDFGHTTEAGDRLIARQVLDAVLRVLAERGVRREPE